ncbi:unnamed protein product [Larinioides sclopetarius]|uniref:Uncharacterized protein n=1 Tax=Larinioides sclopetarius TaxID=280406 RepID=A0AAV1ZY42_9ARAC
MIYSQFTDYPGFNRYDVTAHAFENPSLYIQEGLNYSTNDLQCGYGTPQMNIWPYPTLVYVPQQAFQYPGAVSYPVNSTLQEIIPILPAMLQ